MFYICEKIQKPLSERYASEGYALMEDLQKFALTAIAGRSLPRWHRRNKLSHGTFI